MGGWKDVVMDVDSSMYLRMCMQVHRDEGLQLPGSLNMHPEITYS